MNQTLESDKDLKEEEETNKKTEKNKENQFPYILML